MDVDDTTVAENEGLLNEEANDEAYEEETEENVVKNTEKGKEPKEGKKRKKGPANQRKKIRKLLTHDKLAPETLNALQEEEARQKRLELLKQQNTETNGNGYIDFSALTDDIFPGDDLLTQEDYDQITDEIIANNSSDPLHPAPLNRPNKPTSLPPLEPHPVQLPTESIAPTPEVPPSVSLKPTKKLPGDVICISSDEEDAGTPEVIESDSDDDVICTGDNFHTIADDGGIHVDDARNVKEDNGKVVINVNRPQTEAPIYLSEKLAPFVKPHQIGGIRFMFDNIVESIETFNKSNGLGCILAHAMGLGKTLQVISFIDVFLRHTSAKTVLCIVPVNTLLNWINEFSNWLNVKCLNYTIANDNSENEQTGPNDFNLYILGDGQKSIESRSDVVKTWHNTGGVLLMGYEMYRQLASKKITRRKNKKADLNGEEALKVHDMLNTTYQHIVNPGPDLVICDEGHRIKNSHAGISKVLKQIRTQRRIVLTGYPLQNNLMEYWCMVDFVRPNFLGTRQEFSNMFERPIHNGQCLDSTPSDIRLMRYRSYVLFSQLKGFVQRRSHEVLKENLPQKEEHVLLIRLSDWQKKLYNSFIKTQLQSGNWYSLNPIKAFSICCKIWNHPDILFFTANEKLREATKNQVEDNAFSLDVDLDLPDLLERKSKKNEKEINSLSYDWTTPLLEDYQPHMLEMSGKMVTFVKLLTETVQCGEKILLFSQSLNTLNLIEKFLSKIRVPQPPSTDTIDPGSDEQRKKWSKNESYFRLDGNTNAAERERLVQLFNASTNTKVHLFLLSTRAGCLGINLTGANRVIVFDASWNPCHDAQAVCRVYRYGQQRKCHIYRFVTDNTMEKKIYDRQISKQGMSDRVVDKLNPIQSITRADVSKLMFYTDEDPPPVDLNGIDEEYHDEILKTICITCGHWLTKKPFLHESLFIDNKSQRLTTAEINAAQREYNIEKRTATTCNNPKASYSGFYGANVNQPNGMIRSQSMVTFNNNIPSRATPLPVDPTLVRKADPLRRSPDNMFDSNAIGTLARAGVTVNKIKATSNVPMPNVNRLVNESFNQTPRTLVRVGETMYIIKGQKGLYMATSKGHIFARRSQNYASDPDRYQFEYEQESRLVSTVFNAMTRKLQMQQPSPPPTLINGQSFQTPTLQSSRSYPTFQQLQRQTTEQQAPMLSQLLTNAEQPTTNWNANSPISNGFANSTLNPSDISFTPSNSNLSASDSSNSMNLYLESEDILNSTFPPTNVSSLPQPTNSLQTTDITPTIIL